VAPLSSRRKAVALSSTSPLLERWTLAVTDWTLGLPSAHSERSASGIRGRATIAAARLVASGAATRPSPNRCAGAASRLGEEDVAEIALLEELAQQLGVGAEAMLHRGTSDGRSALRAVLTICAASSALRASGRSHRRGLPASSAAVASARAGSWGADVERVDLVVGEEIVEPPGVRGIWNSGRHAAALTGSRSHSATSSRPSVS